jgi:hypothetical protein
MDSNIPILSKYDFYNLNPDFLFFHDLDFNENFDDLNNSPDFSIKIEKQNEKSINNEVSSIHFSFTDSKINKNTYDNSKSEEMIEINIPHIEKICEGYYSNDPLIFNKTINDNYSNQMINEALYEKNKKCKKVKSSGRKLFTNSPKIRLKKKKNIETRKENTDNIRKKIKAHFIKRLIKEINEKLKIAGSKYIFKLLPQPFVCNVSKSENKDVLDLTFKEILLKNFCNRKKVKQADIDKYNYNLFVLNYLEKNQEICEKSNFNNIKNMKYSIIYNEYLSSKEFGLEITSLKQKNENDKYIKDYIIKARNLLQFFNS